MRSLLKVLIGAAAVFCAATGAAGENLRGKRLELQVPDELYPDAGPEPQNGFDPHQYEGAEHKQIAEEVRQNEPKKKKIHNGGGRRHRIRRPKLSTGGKRLLQLQVPDGLLPDADAGDAGDAGPEPQNGFDPHQYEGAEHKQIAEEVRQNQPKKKKIHNGGGRRHRIRRPKLSTGGKRL